MKIDFDCQTKNLYSVEIQNIVVESIFLTKGKEVIYNKALNEIDTIIQMIDGELIAKED
jgi:hypothetical protein